MKPVAYLVGAMIAVFALMIMTIDASPQEKACPNGASTLDTLLKRVYAPAAIKAHGQPYVDISGNADGWAVVHILTAESPVAVGFTLFRNCLMWSQTAIDADKIAPILTGKTRAELFAPTTDT